MNQKEVSELRRRLQPEKSDITHIYGCYVNSSRHVVSYLDEPLSLMPKEEEEKYLALLKKTLSGTLGKHLIDLIFSTEQVADSEEHRLLSTLRNSELKDAEARKTFYEKVIGSLDMGDTNYLLLLVHDTYNVPKRARDSIKSDTDNTFSYIVCCVCPVKDGKPELGFFPGENEFHNCIAGQIVSPPETGFLFPAFDDRSANIYNVLFYSRSPSKIHHELIDALFRTQVPMTAAEQKDAFQAALSGTLDASLPLLQHIYARLREETQRDSEEPITLTERDFADILRDGGVDDAHIDAFAARCREEFGEGAVLNPANLIDAKQFRVKTPQVSLTLDPEFPYLPEARVIDGRRYLLIPVGGDLEVDGIPAASLAPESAAHEEQE